jgi:poly(A) polymerase
MNCLLSQLKKISIENNTKIFIVGGYIRDLIIGRPNNDIDCVIMGNDNRIIEILAEKLKKKAIKLGDKHKLYRIVDNKNNITIDFTYMNGETIEQDLFKRDFTINSIAVDITDLDNYEGKIIDPTGGFKDIKKGIIRHVYDEAFIDDPVRMLRAIRFMSELDFIIDKNTEDLIRKNKKYIKSIPGERISYEIFKILENRNTSYFFNYMERRINILEEIFPEIIEMRDVGECKYHVVDCLTHSFYTLKVAEDIIYAKGYFEDHVRKAYEEHSKEKIASNHSRLSLIKLGAFFHDVGKPSAKKIDETGRIRFKGHEITGAEMIKKIAERLKLSIKERDMLYKIVAMHMYPLVLYKSNDVSGKTLYKMFSELEEDTLDILLISLADIIATRKLLDPEEEMGKYKVYIEYLANNYLTRYKEIEDISDIITGKDIIENFELDEGIMIGDLLEEIKKAIYNGKIGRNKNGALKYIREILS